MIRFTIKCGLAGAAVYYVADQGVWKQSAETTKLYNRISSFLSPYMQEAKSQLPFKVPELPSSGRVSYLTKQYWNQGVTATFVYIGDFPHYVSEWTKSGVQAVKSNEEVKKLLGTVSGTPEPADKK